MTNKKITSALNTASALMLLIFIILGRLTSYFYTVTSTDITYPDWTVVMSSYLSEALPVLRLSFSFTLIAYAVYNRKNAHSAFILSAAASFMDFAARFLIDYITMAIAGEELLAVIWLAMNLAYELLFIVLSLVAAKMMKLKLSSADDKRKKEKFTENKARFLAILIYALSRIVSEIIYLADFLLTYVNITNSEIASIVGSFLSIFVIYIGFSAIASYFFRGIIAKSAHESV